MEIGADNPMNLESRTCFTVRVGLGELRQRGSNVYHDRHDASFCWDFDTIEEACAAYDREVGGLARWLAVEESGGKWSGFAWIALESYLEEWDEDGECWQFIEDLETFEDREVGTEEN